MKYIKYILGLILILFVLIFLIQNVFVDQGNIYSFIEVKFLSFAVVMPIIVLLFLSFLLGLFVGIIWMSKTIFYLKREVNSKQKEIEKLEKTIRDMKNINIEDNSNEE